MKVAYIVGLVWLALVLSWPMPARAAVAVNQLDLKAALQLDGTVQVTENIHLAGTSQLDWVILTNRFRPQVLADGATVPASDLKLSPITNGYRLQSKTTRAKIWQINFQTSGNLIRHNNRDQFFFKIFQNPGVSVGPISAVFTLPSPVDSQALAGNVYAIGGVIGATQMTDSATAITYMADFAGPKGLMTLNASWPKTLLHLSFFQELRLSLLNLDALPWLLLGGALPIGALFVLIWLSFRQKRVDQLRVVGRIETPPTTVSPVIVGVLVNKKIYPEEIVALLIDLCLRGYLVIIKKDGEYFLGKRRPADHFLQTWEAEIFRTLLPGGDLKMNDDALRDVTKQSLFSPDVRQAFEAVYQVITQNHYFTENPHLTRIRYKLIGLGFYFVGIAGLIWTAITDASPYFIIPLSGTIVLSWLILRLTTRLVNYSATGNRERANWLAFANYLSDPTPVDPTLARGQMFERYLAYAIALRRTAPWAARFDQSSSVGMRPDWFIAYEEMTSAVFAKEIIAFTGKISKLLSQMRGPLVN